MGAVVSCTSQPESVQARTTLEPLGLTSVCARLDASILVADAPNGCTREWQLDRPGTSASRVPKHHTPARYHKAVNKAVDCVYNRE